MPTHIETIFSSFFGASLACFLIKLLITRFLREFSQALDKLDEISKELITVAVRLERVEKELGMVQEHDRKITALEAVQKR